MKKLYQVYRPAIWLGGGFMVILYSMLMPQQLTHPFDGLWNHNYHHAGVPELTSGRWLLRYVDKVTMRLHADPITSLAALALFLLGFLLVLSLLEVTQPAVSALSLGLWLSSVVICCTLSYRMTSLGYALAYLLAVLGLYATVRVPGVVPAVLSGGVLLGLSMACYQTYLGVFCLLALFYLLFLCRTAEEGLAPIGFALLRMLGALVVGGLFYISSLSFFLKYNDASLSNYNGVSAITPAGLLASLPENLGKTYHYFRVYFFTNTFHVNRLQTGGFVLLFLLLAAALVCLAVRLRKHPVRVLVLVLAAAAIPVACNAYLLLAGDKLEFQMAAGLALLVPLSFLTIVSCLPRKRWLWVPCALFGLALLYGSSMQVWFDQEAMYEGRNASETMVTQIITDLKTKDLLSEQYEYFFVGVPARNETFSVSDAYACANGYAQMGNFWVTGSCGQMSYHGLIDTYLGFHLPMSYRSYEELAARYDLAALPTFPQEGYLTLLDDHFVVIKVSQHQEYQEYTRENLR